MKKIFCLLVTYMVLGISLNTVNIVFAASTDNNEIIAESKTIPYPSGYNLTSEGASSYNGVSNIRNSLYYSTLDFFNMKSM
ncbi:hypothetical protein UFO1_2256 [Pelosinus sp. UFO1]|nr:hypothetical protein UFO1_2256 [Pelosinus sp. UFO1]